MWRHQCRRPELNVQEEQDAMGFVHRDKASDKAQYIPALELKVFSSNSTALQKAELDRRKGAWCGIVQEDLQK